MEFREEYKKSMESNSPDREAMDRMKAAVMAKIAAGEGEPGIPAGKKKPLPLRRIAYIGGAAAACAVIAVSTATILPNVGKNNDMVSAAESVTYATDDSFENAVAGDTAAGEGDPGFAAEATETTQQEAETAQDIPEYAAEDDDEVCESTAPVTTTAPVFTDSPSDNGGGIWGIAQGEPTDGAPADEVADNADSTAADDNTVPSDAKGTSPGETPVTDEPEYDDKGVNGDDGFYLGETCEAGGTIDQSVVTGEYDNDVTVDESPITETAEVAEETCEIWEDDTMEVTEEAGVEEVFIVFSGKGWISFAGERYDPVDPAVVNGEETEALDPVSKKYYTVVRNGDIICVYQNKEFIGTFRKHNSI